MGPPVALKACLSAVHVLPCLQEVGLVRHRQAAPAAPGALLCSRAVTCGGMCHTSAIRPSASYPPEVPPPPVAPGETPPPDPFEQYEAQARDVSNCC